MRNELASIYGWYTCFIAIQKQITRTKISSDFHTHMISAIFIFFWCCCRSCFWKQTSALPSPESSNRSKNWQKYYINMTQRSVKDKINILLTWRALFFLSLPFFLYSFAYFLFSFVSHDESFLFTVCISWLSSIFLTWWISFPLKIK